MYNYSLFFLVLGFVIILMGGTGFGVFFLVIAFLYSRLGVFAENTIKKREGK